MRPLNRRDFVALFGAAAAAAAQNVGSPVPRDPPKSASPAEGDVPVFRGGTKLVDLHVSVLDKNGKLITDIPESAFNVYENGVEQPLKIFRREDIPVSMGIIIDNSGSMRPKRAKVAAASLALVKASNPQDEEFIVDFNDGAYLDQTLTNDIQKLGAALDRLDSRGRTAMRTAISFSIDYVRKSGKHDKKVLVVVTDGNDNVSDGNPSQEALVRTAQRSEVLIYCIGLLSEEAPRDARDARGALKALAEASGGLDYYPKDLAEVERITPQIAHEIRNQYLLAYTPTNPALDGTFRKIEVKVKGYGNPSVRARSGYYAMPEATSESDIAPLAPTPPPALPSAVGKLAVGELLELRCLGEQALIILDVADAKRTFLVADPKKVEVSGGATDFVCGVQPGTPLRVEYSLSKAPEVDGEVRALYVDK
jgi:Ca-activated chloride channel homolog